MPKSILFFTLFILAALSTWAQQNTNCAVPYLTGRWTITEMTPRLQTQGSWNTGGNPTTLTGDMQTALLPNTNATWIRVACDGSVSGIGHERMTGTQVMETTAEGITVILTTQFEGERTFNISGVAITNGANYELILTNTVTSGFQTATTTANIPGFPPTVDRRNLAGTTSSTRFAVTPLFTSESELDYSQNQWFKDFEQTLQSSAQGQLNFTYSGKVTARNTSPELIELKALHPSFYLKDVNIEERFVLDVRWKDSSDRKAEFHYGNETKDGIMHGFNQVYADFDMAEEHTQVRVVVKARDEPDQEMTYEFHKVEKPAWVTEPWQASSGIEYKSKVYWPVDFNPSTVLPSDPWIQGGINLLVDAQTVANIKVMSSGEETTDAYHAIAKVWLPFTGIDYSLEAKGTTTNQLTENGLLMKGNASFRLPQIVFQKHFGFLDVVGPGGNAFVCGVSQTLCSYLNSIGLNARLIFRSRGNGTYEAGTSDINWTGGYATFTVRADAELRLLPPPVNKYFAFSIVGGAAACVTLQFYPDVKFVDPGLRVDLSVYVNVLGLGAIAGQEVRSFGAGCIDGGVGPAAAMALTANSDLPLDATPTIALGRSNYTAITWAAYHGSEPRPASDIFVRLSQGTNTYPIIKITDDIAADQAPVCAFDSSGNLLVVWQRNERTLTNSGISQLSNFAPGFEIYYARINPVTASVISSGRLTQNNLVDLAPQLSTSPSGEIQLAWQSSLGPNFFGTEADPLSINHRTWNNGTWATESPAATNLVNILGWKVASGPNNSALFAATRDKDNILETRSDREILLITKTGNNWTAPWLLTTNNVDDSFPQPYFLTNGTPGLLWSRNNEVWGLLADFFATPVRAWTETNNAGIAHSQVVPHPAGLLVVWPGVNDLYYSIGRFAGSNVLWDNVELLTTTPTIEGEFAVKSDGNNVRLASLNYPANTPVAMRSLTVPWNIRDITFPMDAPANDLDRDGFTNAQELHAGTDSLSAASQFRILQIQPASSGGARITWSSIPGQYYAVESSTDLVNWNLEGRTTSITNETTFETAPSHSHLFYRVIID